MLYIGQSYGEDGSRRAHERLENHSTLQKIYYEAIQRSPDKEIWLMLWGFSPLLLGNIDGKSKEYRVSDEDDDAHSNLVFQKGISEQHSINFTEAALIRYFGPEYNSIFKDTFPDTSHSTYSECYDIDLHSIIVELQTETINCRIWSPQVPAKWTHYAAFALHSFDDRRAFLNL